MDDLELQAVRIGDEHRIVSLAIARLARIVGRGVQDLPAGVPDSLVDLLVSDVLVSNYSSLLNAWYYTGKPSLHVDPHDASAARQVSYKMRFGLPMPERLDSITS